MTKIREQNPEVTREAHLHRIAGSKRWMILADGIAELDLPEGFAVVSTEKQHNGGQYALSFPGGVWTIKREPHPAGEDRTYLQDAFDGFLEEIPVPEELKNRPVQVYLSVAAVGRAKFIASHPALPHDFEIALDEFESDASIVSVPGRPTERPVVRSTRPAARPAEPGDA